ncbi:MAG: flippase-like domain-containing protein [Clostridia bacterium]|nr:flippase-like domain-containing protein [Clostridia bacterium]
MAANKNLNVEEESIALANENAGKKPRETNTDQLVDKENPPKKRHLPIVEEARLKNILYKKTKIRKLRKNYGANLSDDDNYFVSILSCERALAKENEKREDHVKKTKARHKKNPKKKRLLNFLYFALNIAVIVIVLWVQLAKEKNPLESLAAIFDANWWFIAAAIGTFFLCMLMDTTKFSFLIHKATGNFRFRLSYKVATIGRHYDVITPLSTGGQPFQVFYTNKYGIKAGEGVSIAMGKYIFYQIIYFIGISIVLFGNLFSDSIVSVTDSVAGGLVTTLSWIGYCICGGLIFIVMFISFNRRAGAGLIIGILRFLDKIKIGKFKLIKDYKKTFVTAMKTVNSWQATTRKYSKSFWVIFINVVCSIVYFLSWYSMPYLIYCSFNGWDPNMWVTIITMAVMVDLSSAFNPIPMGVGTADLSFTVLYGSLFATGAQVWALIIWRILAFYIYIIQGLGLLTYDYVIGDKRLKKYKEYWLMPYRERLKYRIRERRAKRKAKQNKQLEK